MSETEHTTYPDRKKERGVGQARDRTEGHDDATLEEFGEELDAVERGDDKQTAGAAQLREELDQASGIGVREPTGGVIEEEGGTVGLGEGHGARQPATLPVRERRW